MELKDKILTYVKANPGRDDLDTYCDIYTPGLSIVDIWYTVSELLRDGALVEDGNGLLWICEPKVSE